MPITAKEDAVLAVNHKLSLEGRNKLTVTGVTDVASFDETAAVLETSRGTLILRGHDLHVEQLNLGSGEVKITGEIDTMIYEESARTQGSFLSRLFK